MENNEITTYNESDMAETITYVYPPDDEPTAFCNSGLVDLEFVNPVIKFVKTHPDAVLPTSNHDSDTGYDVYAVEDTAIPARGKKVVPVGLEFAEIPDGFWIRVEGRSGLSFKHSIIPHFGIIDCVPAGTMITTPSGDIEVTELFSSLNRDIISYNLSSHQPETDYIKDMWVVPNSDLLKIELDDRTICVPPTKQLLTKNGWKMADSLSVDEEILCL